MAKNSIDAYGAAGKSNVLFFDPAALTLITDPSHALFDRRALLPPDEALVMNIMQLGVLETIIVAKDVESGETFVVDGRRRTIAAREANRRLAELGKPLVRIPALPRRDGMAGLNRMMVAANEIRRADSVINRAEKMAGMRLRGHTDEEIAIDFNIGPETVPVLLKLLDCCMDVRNAIEDGTITQAIAMKLSKLLPDEQRAKLAAIKVAIEGKTGHARSRAMRGAMQDAAPARRARPKRAEIVEALKTATGERAEALRWVLGLSDGEQPPETDPRQATIDEAIAAN
ncbi:ParB/RepB/Spo0J family partition protein [Burkholderia gladioli]|uniref:ParB/RepB/Spo0J family partition protein n=1 Tax=Burkholderia gladioli TaxID=28095 RepID=UPI003AFB138C